MEVDTNGRPLSGCAALVTGASSGIGAATARALAGQGAAVGLVARRAERLEELAAAIREENGDGATRVVVHTADLTDPEQARGAVEGVSRRLGRLDVLVNGAGFMARGAVEESDPDNWRRLVDLNLTAVLHTSQVALPHLLSAAANGPRGVADLVNVSSVAGRVPRRNNSVYSATKHAVVAFSEALRQEVTGRRVRVGLVEPGVTATEMTAGGMGELVMGGMPQEDWLRADDIARAVVFMVTQPAHAAVNELLLRPTAQEL
ncbi:SDR family oxidoreductase [Streptomyces sp. UNOC14_S4]|uniref:SDR family oxidoreductase n=1 Tax=Streptomyces sp. UNOC14_S4 TaxID=2872340 RepID=UPI001E3D52A6|nr:SDR family NAD(P)-dependent oxidoreductase [Streptomyces sp. UNOC14_S4]